MGSKLFSDYVSNSESAREFYPSHFRDESAWQNAMAQVSSRETDYSRLAQILRRQNLAMGSGRETMENIDKLAVNPTYAVVTGQQVGILTGPLYTIYKALSDA